jgi:hypothetical protein
MFNPSTAEFAIKSPVTASKTGIPSSVPSCH